MTPKSEMRPPWRRIALFLITLLCLYATLLQISERTVPEYSLKRERIAGMLSQADMIEAITLGNSHSMAIDFKTLGLHGYHLWVSGGDLFETEYLAERYLAHLSRLRLLFIPLSYPIFYQDNGKAANHNRRVGIYTAMRQLAPWTIIDGDWKNYLRSWIIPVARSDHWRHIFRYLLLGIIPSRGYVLKADGNLILKWKPWNPEAVDVRSLKFDANRHLWLVEQAIAKAPEVEGRAEECLRSLVHNAKQRGIRVILYTPPYTRIYTERIREKNPELLTQHQKIIHRLVAEEHVDYYDFSYVARLVDQPDYFVNEDHMSLKGAKVFSQELRRVAGL